MKLRCTKRCGFWATLPCISVGKIFIMFTETSIGLLFFGLTDESHKSRCSVGKTRRHRWKSCLRLWLRQCVQKKKPKCFSRNIFYKTPSDSDKIWYTVSWMNLLQNDIHAFHLIFTLYPVKLKMLIEHVLPLSCLNPIIYSTSTVSRPFDLRRSIDRSRRSIA